MVTGLSRALAAVILSACQPAAPETTERYAAETPDGATKASAPAGSATPSARWRGPGAASAGGGEPIGAGSVAGTSGAPGPTVTAMPDAAAHGAPAPTGSPMPDALARGASVPTVTAMPDAAAHGAPEPTGSPMPDALAHGAPLAPEPAAAAGRTLTGSWKAYSLDYSTNPPSSATRTLFLGADGTFEMRTGSAYQGGGSSRMSAAGMGTGTYSLVGNALVLAFSDGSQLAGSLTDDGLSIGSSRYYPCSGWSC